MGTMAATVLGGASTVGTVRLATCMAFRFLAVRGTGCGIIALNLFLAKPLLKLKIYTVTQVLEKRYNPMARSASAAIMLAYALMIGVTSILAIGTVLQVLFDLPFGSRYSSWRRSGDLFGDWRHVVADPHRHRPVHHQDRWPDVILLPICLYRVGGWDELVLKLPATAFSFTTIGWDTIITYFMIYFFGILIGQDIWQRVFTVKTAKVAQYAGSIAGIYCIIYGLACALIGMAAHVLIPDLDNVNNAFAAIVKLSLPDGIRGLVIAAALAAMMSTASAGLLAAATTLTEDLLPKLRGGKPSSLRINRLFTLLTGIVVLGIALVVNDVISALTLAYNLLVGGMLVPLIGAIFWKRATTAGAIASMGLGFATALLFMFKDGLDANTPIYYSLAVGLVSFVVVSLMSPRPATVASAI